jgi:hypothetical protein
VGGASSRWGLSRKAAAAAAAAVRNGRRTRGVGGATGLFVCLFLPCCVVYELFTFMGLRTYNQYKSIITIVNSCIKGVFSCSC